jgi:hypothetical protein
MAFAKAREGFAGAAASIANEPDSSYAELRRLGGLRLRHSDNPARHKDYSPWGKIQASLRAKAMAAALGSAAASAAKQATVTRFQKQLALQQQEALRRSSGESSRRLILEVEEGEHDVKYWEQGGARAGCVRSTPMRGLSSPVARTQTTRCTRRRTSTGGTACGTRRRSRRCCESGGRRWSGCSHGTRRTRCASRSTAWSSA